MKISVRVIFVSNLTTHVELRNGQRIFGEKKELKKQVGDAVFVELTDSGLKLDMPLRMCSQGHRLEFELEVKTPSRDIRFPAQGVVLQSESFAQSHDNVTIRLVRFDQTVWSMILELFQQQQAQVADLFKKLKGVEAS